MPVTFLPPWPDELLVPDKKELAIAHLRGLRIPSRYAALQLGRWAAFLGLELEPRDFHAVRRDVRFPDQG